MRLWRSTALFAGDDAVTHGSPKPISLALRDAKFCEHVIERPERDRFDEAADEEQRIPNQCRILSDPPICRKHVKQKRKDALSIHTGIKSPPFIF
jgi:hypothetical protein